MSHARCCLLIALALQLLESGVLVHAQQPAVRSQPGSYARIVVIAPKAGQHEAFEAGELLRYRAELSYLP